MLQRQRVQSALICTSWETLPFLLFYSNHRHEIFGLKFYSQLQQDTEKHKGALGSLGLRNSSFLVP